MIRYLVFAGPDYYPAGGWHDFVGAFATFEEADAKATAYTGDWAYVVDLARLEIANEASWAPDWPSDRI